MLRWVLLVLVFYAPLVLAAEDARTAEGAQKVVKNDQPIAYALDQARYAELYAKYDSLQSRVDVLKVEMDSNYRLVDKDVSALSERISNQDSKIGTQNSHIANGTAWIGIAFLVFAAVLSLAGFLGYFTVRKMAKEEAEKVAEIEVNRWFSEKSQRLDGMLSGLAERVKVVEDQAREAVDRHEQRVREFSDRAIDSMQRALDSPMGPGEEIGVDETMALKESAGAVKEKSKEDRRFVDWNVLAFDAFRGKDMASAVGYWRNALTDSEVASKDRASAEFNIAKTLSEMGDRSASIQAYEELIANHSTDESTSVQRIVARSMVNLASQLGKIERAESAIDVLDEVIKKYSNSEVDALRETAARSYFNKARILGVLHGMNVEIAIYDELIGNFGNEVAVELAGNVVNALSNKSQLLCNAGDYEKSIASCNELIDKFDGSKSEAIEARVARARVTLGDAHAGLGNYSAAHSSFDSAIALTEGNERRSAVLCDALNNKGFCFLIQAKREWGQIDKRNVLLSQAAVLFAQAEKMDFQTHSVKWNMIYCAYLLDGDVDAAVVGVDQLLDAGGKALYETIKGDVDFMPVDKDVVLKNIIDELWERHRSNV